MKVITYPSDTQFVKVGPKRWRYGTIGNNYWTGNCKAYSRTLVFDIGDLEGVRTFKLLSGGWDDFMNISINGRKVVSVPFDHELGKGRPCDLEKSWVFNINPGIYGRVPPTGNRPREITVNGDGSERLSVGGISLGRGGLRYGGFVTHDLKPFLKKGRNELVLDVDVGGAGEGWFDLYIDADPDYCSGASKTTSDCTFNGVSYPESTIAEASGYPSTSPALRGDGLYLENCDPTVGACSSLPYKSTARRSVLYPVISCIRGSWACTSNCSAMNMDSFPKVPSTPGK